MMTEFKIDSQVPSFEQHQSSDSWSNIASCLWSESNSWTGKSSASSISEASNGFLPDIELPVFGFVSDKYIPKSSKDGIISSDRSEMAEQEESVDDEISSKYIEDLRKDAAKLIRELALATIGLQTRDNPNPLNNIKEETLKHLIDESKPIHKQFFEKQKRELIESLIEGLWEQEAQESLDKSFVEIQLKTSKHLMDKLKPHQTQEKAP